eukprot:GILK01012623.1.p1 GENE.GILK01012623.1~~GILK01012623.1.p1  ORF type:complete len:267 (-),score=35.81 GILK01012623.1:95-895(-)
MGFLDSYFLPLSIYLSNSNASEDASNTPMSSSDMDEYDESPAHMKQEPMSPSSPAAWMETTTAPMMESSNNAWQHILQQFQTAFELDQHLRKHQLNVLQTDFFVRGSARKQYMKNLGIALCQYEERWKVLIASHILHATTDITRTQFARVLQIALDQYQQDWKSQIAFQGGLFVKDDDKLDKYNEYMRHMDQEHLEQRLRLLKHSCPQPSRFLPTHGDTQSDMSMNVPPTVPPQDMVLVQTGNPGEPLECLMSTEELEDITENFFG